LGLKKLSFYFVEHFLAIMPLSESKCQIKKSSFPPPIDGPSFDSPAEFIFLQMAFPLTHNRLYPILHKLARIDPGNMDYPQPPI
jgi:hypothetical protein